MTTTTNPQKLQKLIIGRGQTRPLRELHLPLGLTWTGVALALIVVLAAALRLYNLQSVGNANEYYTAAVKGMLQSFRNFFFAAAEPGGSVTVDKPPLGLWLQAISAMIFGVSGVSVVLPQVIAGILSVPLLFRLVRHYFGEIAGLIAAFALAVTPVSIAVERNNTMDATLIFTLLLATWAFIRATDTGKLRYLLLGALLVGLGFNIKMLQAFLPLPAFYTLYLFGAKVGLKRKIMNLVLATLVLLTVSFSWATVVTLTPADQRPYIGSTETNNVFDLIFGYNGLNRLIGNTPGSGSRTAPTGTTPAATNGFQPPADGTSNFQPPQGLPGNGGPGGFNIGQAGVFRLVTTPLANEVGWLLPFGLLSLGLLIVSRRIKFPLDEKHQAAVLFGGWLLTAAVFFSVAGFFHPYYLSMLAAPLAALVGIGAVRLWTMYRSRPLIAGLFVIAVVGATVAIQAYIAQQYVSNVWWIIPAGLLVGAGGALMIARRQVMRAATIGFVCLLVATLWTPTAWAAMTSANSNSNSVLPEAFSGTGNAQFPMGDGRDGMNRTTDSNLLNYLQANTQDVEFLVAVSSSMQGAPYVLATGRPVFYMGGFSGSDPVMTATKLAQLVSEHKLRYVLQGGGGMPGMGSDKTEVSNWLQANCKAVPEFSSGSSSSGGFMQSTLYQCGT